MRESGATWGYDPTFMAGALFTPVFDPSNYLMELFAAMLPFFSTALVIKLLFIGGIGFIPLLIFFAARNFSFNRSVSVAAGFFAASYLWFGLPLDVTRYGMFLYILGAAWGVFVLGWWVGLAERGRWQSGLGLIFSGALSIPIHMASLFVVALPGALSFVIYLRRMDRRRWIWTIAALVATMAGAFPWIGPYIKFQGLKTTAAIDLQSIPLSGTFSLITNGHASLETLMWLFAAAGILAMRREFPARRWVPILMGVLTLAFLYFGGHFWGIVAELSPRRFAVPLYFLLTLPAARGIGLLVGWLTSFTNRKKAVAVIALLIIALVPAFSRGVKVIRAVMGSILTGVPPGAATLYAWMNSATDKSGRILIEPE